MMPLQILERIDKGTNSFKPNLHLLPILDDALGVSRPSNSAWGTHLDDSALLDGRSLAQE